LGVLIFVKKGDLDLFLVSNAPLIFLVFMYCKC